MTITLYCEFLCPLQHGIWESNVLLSREAILGAYFYQYSEMLLWALWKEKSAKSMESSVPEMLESVQ